MYLFPQYRRSVSCLFLAALVMSSGCSSNGGDKAVEVKQWLGPDVTEEEVLAAVEELSALVDEAFLETGYAPTEFADMPSKGSATYSGLMLGEGQPDSGPLVDYAADLRLDASFATQSLDGTITNVATRLEGFDHPDGTITVTGSIYNDSGFGGLEFGGTGELQQGELSATYLLPEVFGYFGGSNAQAIEGYQATNFEWTSGPHAGTNSSSDGLFMGIRQ